MVKSNFPLLLFSLLLVINNACLRSSVSTNESVASTESANSVANSLMKAGQSYLKVCEDSSYIFYSMALKLAQEKHLDSIKPQSYYSLAIIYKEASDLRMAAIYLDSAMVSSTKEKDYEWLSNAYNALGNLELNLFDSINAKCYYDSAYAIAQRHSLKRQSGIALASLAKYDNDVDIMNEKFKMAIRVLSSEPGNEEEIALLFVNIGMNGSNPDTAIRYFQKAIDIARKVKSPEIEMAAYNNMAYSFLDKAQPELAEQCLKYYAIPLAEQEQNYDWLSTLYDSYSDVFIARSKPMEAFTFERLALNSRARADGLEAKAQVRLLSTILDLKNKQILIQKQQTEVRQKDYKIRLIYLWGSVGSLIIFAIIAVYFWRQQREKIRMQSELINSAKHLIEAEENLKGRASMELHDMVTPFYTTMFRAIDNAGIQDRSVERELKGKVSELSDVLRKLSHQMSNNFREQLDLPALIHGLADDFRRVSNVPVEVFTNSFNAELSGEKTIHLYRIVQELLANALKYITDGAIKISLAEEMGILFILYSDTGPGFNKDNAGKNGIGIMNIFERAKIIRGKAVLTTSPGKGTQWRITVPLNS